MNAAIAVQEISKTYPRAARPALRELSFEVGPGEVFGIVGPNGAGKTTLFGCLLGLLKHEGQVLISGRSPREAAARAGFGYVPERLTFERWMKARDFVAFHHALAGQGSESRARAVNGALEKVGIRPEDWGQRVAKFSRGNLQRLALAQALVAGPSFLFLDEPTSGMDPLGVAHFKDLVREAAAGGCTVVLNSHQLNQVEDLCGRVAILAEGRLVEVKALGRQRKKGLAYRLRWREVSAAKRKAALASLEKLKAIELEMADEDGQGAVFLAADEAGASHLLAVAVDKGLPVIEAGWVTGGLEAALIKAAGVRR